MMYVASELRARGPKAIAICTASLAYASVGQAHPAVVATLRPVVEFTSSRLRFIYSPKMLVMLFVLLAIAGVEAMRGHDLFSLAMPSVAVGMIAGFIVCLMAMSWVIQSIDVARLMPRRVSVLPPEARSALPRFFLPVPFEPPRAVLVNA